MFLDALDAMEKKSTVYGSIALQKLNVVAWKVLFYLQMISIYF